MGHSKSASKETKSQREDKWKRLAKIVALSAPFLAYGAAVSRDQVTDALRRVMGAHLTVTRSEIKPAFSVVRGIYSYEGTLVIVNKGPAAGHHMRFAVVSPAACRLGDPEIATWPTTSGPHMHPNRLPFATGLKIDSEIWTIDFWRKDEVLILHYRLNCSNSLRENLRLGIDKFDTAHSTSISIRQPFSRARIRARRVS